MKTRIALIIFLVLVCSPFYPALGQTYESISRINSTNFAKYFCDLLGYLYDSHGCLHFTPSDIYLLAKTIPPGTPLTIKPYGSGELPEGYDKAQVFNESTNSEQDIKYYADIFKNYKTRLVVFPSAGRLFILINDAPYLQVMTRPGPPANYRMVYRLENNGPIEWDLTLNTPTDAGDYTILRGITHYLSNLYRLNTIVPFGAMMAKRGGHWKFQENNQWHPLPQHIIADLELPKEQRVNDYYESALDGSGKTVSARWGSNDFGKYALLWTKDGNNRYPELGYAEGLLLYEQTLLVKDLAAILTAAGPDQFENCIAKNEAFLFYKEAAAFVNSSGKAVSDKLDPTACAYYKLFNDLKLTPADRQKLDRRLVAAVNDFREQHLPDQLKEIDRREKELGLYSFIKDYDFSFRKQAHWYQKIKDDWAFWSGLRALLRKDFEDMRISSLEKRKALVEDWINGRLEFRLARPPQL